MKKILYFAQSKRVPDNISYLVTSNRFVDFPLSFKELSKEFMRFRIPLLDFKIIGYMSRMNLKKLLKSAVNVKVFKTK